ncbi:MAG: glycosyltransferase family 2 protein [Methylotenera sp.]|nr:glycosyltransferase family 2 protein [Methylotenera sp.]
MSFFVWLLACLEILLCDKIRCQDKISIKLLLDMTNKITSVIPTKNRPHDLIKAVSSVISQTRLPDELIIVDQSSDDKSLVLVDALMMKYSNVQLIYIHDPLISGLVDAKRVAVENAVGNIICFLEDDVILETDFIEQIEKGFVEKSDMLGCCGIITNPPQQTVIYEVLFKLFHRGIFKDIRVGLYGKFSGRENSLISSDKLSGGLSAWHRDVFKVVSFDVSNGFHMFEDVDFSTRVSRIFGSRLYINPNARLAHYCSPVNREILGQRQKRKLTECIVYYKKRRSWPGATLALIWLLLGMFLEVLFQSYSARSFEPVQGYFSGLCDGFAKQVIPS